MIECSFCGKKYTKKGIGSHIWRTHGKGKNHDPNIGYADGTRSAWNKGLTKETHEAVRRNAETCSKTIKKQISEGTYIPRKMSDSARKKLSIEQSIKNRGGKSKWFDVDGKKVQGTWERDLAIKFNELGIRWTKLKTHKDVWPYVIDGQLKHYTPDFYLPDFDVYLDPKGYWWGDDKRKIEEVKKQHNDKRLVIIEKELFETIIKSDDYGKVAQLVVAAD